MMIETSRLIAPFPGQVVEVNDGNAFNGDEL